MEYGDTYVPIFRSLLNHRYMQDAEKLRFWVWCLLKATHTPYKQIVGNQTVPLEIGQFVFGRQAAAKELGLSEQNIRTLLKFFSSKSEEKLTIKTTNKYSVITVIKFEEYLDRARKNNQQNNQKLTSTQPASNHKQEGKEGKEENLKAIVPFAAIIDYLNVKAGKNFKVTEMHQRHINARWKDGYRVEDFKAVIDKKVAEWGRDPKMAPYLRPETLFGTKFDSYLNEVSQPNIPKQKEMVW